MAGSCRDSRLQQRAFLDVRVSSGFIFHVTEVAGPACEMGNRPRADDVEHLDGQPARLEIGHHLRQRGGPVR